jgi:hypothetical protein
VRKGCDAMADKTEAQKGDTPLPTCVFFVFVLSLDEETLSVACPVATTTSHHAQGDRGYPAFPRRNGWRGGKALNVRTTQA